MPGILNPVTAACDRGYVPDEVWVLSDPRVADSVADATDQFYNIIKHRSPWKNPLRSFIRYASEQGGVFNWDGGF